VITPTDAIITSIRSLAARCQHLNAEAARLEHHIDTITAAAAPALRAVYGVGPDTAATLMAAIGDNAHRNDHEAAFAKLCGVCPREASSGKTIRHRLNRGGNRDATGPYTSSWWFDYAATNPRATTWRDASPKANRRTR
jgi:transposase